MLKSPACECNIEINKLVLT